MPSIPVRRLSSHSLTLVTLIALVALAALWAGGPLDGRESALASHAGGMDAMSIDMDPSATPMNTSIIVGTRQDCARINENDMLDADEDTTADTLTIDVTASVIPLSNPMTAFSYNLNYDEANLSMQSQASLFLLSFNAGSSLFNASDPLPDSNNNNNFNSALLDSSASTPEMGSGVLDRLTISTDSGAAQGQYALTLPVADAVHLDQVSAAQYPDAINNASIAVNEGCPLPPADVEMVALTLTSIGGPSYPAGTDFTAEVVGTATNNGPNPADIQIDLTLAAPPDCTLTPPGGQSEGFANVPSTESRISTRQWTVNCSQTSSHLLSASGSVTITGLADESYAGNNGPLTDDDTVAITGTADPKVSSVTVAAPGSAATGAPFNVTVTANLHNNGTLSPVNADTTLDLTVPGSCGRSPDNPQVVAGTSLATSVPTPVQATWIVTCSSPGLKNFTGTGTVSINQLHATDGNGGNNSESGGASTDTSLSQADVKVTSVTVSSPPSAPISTNFPVTVSTLVHNNGPFFPVNTDVTLTLNLPADCFTPISTLVMQNASLGPSVAAMLPQITFFVACIDHSTHNITATATIVIDDPLAGDPIPANNSATSAASTTAIIRTSDLKAVSATVGVPISATTNTAFNVTVDGTLHNNGPDSAPASASVMLNLPADCTTPTNPLVVGVTLAVSVATALPTQTFPVTCTDRSNHDFTAMVTLTGPLHVNDPDGGNNSTTSVQSTVPVFDVADLKVTSVTTGVPVSANVGVPFNVAATVNVHNNGPFGPANADVTATLSLPADCTPAEANPQTVQDTSVPFSAVTPVVITWSVTCTLQSSHTFSSSGTVTLDQFHVSDPVAGNNSGASANAIVPVLAQADGKISSSVLLSPPTVIAANTNINITVRKMLHNNGPFGPATFNLTKSVTPPAGCTVTPPVLSAHNLAVSVATQVDEVWVINCVPGSYTINFQNTLSVTGLHIQDPIAGNNSATTPLSVVVDTDGDGIPDDVEVACGSSPTVGTSIPERVDGIFAGVSDDGDVAIDEALPAGAIGFDCDRDGYTGTKENHVYSYVPQTNGDQKVCQEYDLTHPNASHKPSLRWPSDLSGHIPLSFSNNKINVSDLASFVAPIHYLGTNVGTNPGDVRWDLRPGTGGPLPVSINVIDLADLIAGTTGSPPMLGGVRAFLGPDCPFAP